ncbi:hypothetical protein QAA70_008025 [Enterobacter chengduensis]|uniref:hypothetical protein n=1 Tax=Enterobacter chengduensis TaxID=2494701 RepID=UPI00254EF821|nr:hypothetical protein [Enterobacter chengduensis]MEC5765017.1 hypothetical protein [Enterobacter chengduensis]
MLAADEKELAYQRVCYWRFKRSFRFARQMQNYTLFLRANEACSITAAHTLSGRQSRHLILQVRRHLLLWIHPATVFERNWKAPRKIPLRPDALTPALSHGEREKNGHKKAGLKTRLLY